MATLRLLHPCPSGSRLAAAPGARPRLPPRPRSRMPARVHAGKLEIALQSVESRLDQWIAAAGVGAERVAHRLQACLVGLLLALQRLVRWVRLTTLALTLSQQQQGLLAFAGAGTNGSADTGSSSHVSSDAVAPHPAAAEQHEPAAASSSGSMADFLSAATLGAVEQLRHTLMDASQGIDSKMSVIERTASSVQGTLFQAAQAHSEAVRSNPQVGMWKQPSVEAVLSEEERLRQAVFAQVYAELLQKDNKSISYNAQP